MTITITAAGTTVVTTHLIRLGLRYLPFQFVKRRSLRRRCTRLKSMDGYLFPLRHPQAAANITIGLETTAQTRATRHRTWARGGENAATTRVRLAGVSRPIYPMSSTAELVQKPTFSSITQRKLNCLGW